LPEVSPFLPAADNIVYGSALENIAVVRACGAAHRAFLAAIAGGKPDDAAWSEGAAAYRFALPPLDSAENIRNFISAVAHGMLIRIIDPAEAPRLLYAAQCAVAAVRKSSNMPSQIEVSMQE
jgi:hypothetical protein